MDIYRSSYKDCSALCLENDLLKVSVLPEIGGKIASIYVKKHNYEYLVQNPGRKYRHQEYNSDYISGECSGFDDMFPTIDACYYEEYPWKGTLLPDHGEVWSLEWDAAIGADTVSLKVDGIHMPYTLEKKISFLHEHTVRIDYRLINRSAFSMFFLWAAHMMINIEEGTRILLPSEVQNITTVMSNSKRLGGYGSIQAWPEVSLPTGEKERIDVSRSGMVCDMEKYYLADPLTEGWCSLEYPDGKLFSLEFPPEEVPYLGILMNENGWNNNGTWENLYSIFLEPCTSSFDRIDAARLRNQCSMIGPKSEYCWYLHINSGEK